MSKIHNAFSQNLFLLINQLHPVVFLISMIVFYIVYNIFIKNIRKESDLQIVTKNYVVHLSFKCGYFYIELSSDNRLETLGRFVHADVVEKSRIKLVFKQEF